MARAFIYIRCSHRESEQSGLGMDAQFEQSIKYAEYIKAARYPDLQIERSPYVDGSVSAFQRKTRIFFKRPKGALLHAKLKRGDHVIFARLDRAFRYPPDFYATYENFE